MRMLRTLFVVSFTVLTFPLFCGGNLHAAMVPDASGSVYRDYFDHITLFSEGRITRFTQMPIWVYISPVVKESPYLPEIRHAMQAWQTVSDGDIRFEETEIPQNADIRVSWGHNALYNGFQDMRLGSAELTRRNTQAKALQNSHQFPSTGELLRSEGSPETSLLTTENRQPTANLPIADSRQPTADSQFTVEIILMLEGDGTIGELSQEEMRTVCLHEFGHAIGLWGA